MKFGKFTWLLMGVLSLAVIAATTSTVITQTKDLKIQNTTDTVALTIQKGSLTSNAVEILSGSTLKFAVPASGHLPVIYGGTGTNTAAGARANLGLPESSTNSILPVASGGTGTNTAAGVRAVLGLNAAVTNTTTAGFRSDLGLGEAATNCVATTNGTVTGLTLVGSTTNADLTASLPVFTDANKVSVSKSVADTKIALGIQAGTTTASADGTVTNTFATAFSTAPIVVVTPEGVMTNAPSIAAPTTTNVVITATNGMVLHWIAIGAP